MLDRRRKVRLKVTSFNSSPGYAMKFNSSIVLVIWYKNSSNSASTMLFRVSSHLPAIPENFSGPDRMMSQSMTSWSLRVAFPEVASMCGIYAQGIIHISVQKPIALPWHHDITFRYIIRSGISVLSLVILYLLLTEPKNRSYSVLVPFVLPTSKLTGCSTNSSRPQLTYWSFSLSASPLSWQIRQRLMGFWPQIRNQGGSTPYVNL